MPWSDDELTTIAARAADDFDALPAYHLGQSAKLRRTAVDGLLAQRLVPSLNSITFERKGHVAGTDAWRLAISEVLWSALHDEGLETCHLARSGDVVLVSEERATPVEVIVKAAWVGTPTRIYEGLSGRVDRFGAPFVEHARHAPYVRFDYRNPLTSPSGKALRDECLPEALADRLIDTAEASKNALRIFDVVRRRFERAGFEVWDACFLFDESGRVFCYELSPDNMRVKSAGWADDPSAANEFDKDLWRRGEDDAVITRQWRTLHERLWLSSRSWSTAPTARARRRVSHTSSSASDVVARRSRPTPPTA